MPEIHDSEEARLVWERYQEYIKNKKKRYREIPPMNSYNKSFFYKPLDVYLTKTRVETKRGLGQPYYEDIEGDKYSYCFTCDKIKPLNSDNFFKLHTVKLGYRVPCKNCEKLIQRYKRDTNPELKERMNRQSTQWTKNNRKKANKRNKERRREKMKNPEYRKKYNKYHSEYLRQKRKDDPAYRLACNVSRVVRTAIKRTNKNSTSKGGKTFENLPYTPKMLVEHLESQFDENMSWDNYGTYWHIDHIIPQAMTPYDSIKHENFQKAWALENLQPLEAIANMSKNSIYNGEKKYYKDHK